MGTGKCKVNSCTTSYVLFSQGGLQRDQTMNTKAFRFLCNVSIHSHCHREHRNTGHLNGEWLRAKSSGPSMTVTVELWSSEIWMECTCQLGTGFLLSPSLY